MRLGHRDSFDVLCDAQEDQERAARHGRADELRLTSAFIRTVSNDVSEFDGSGWASIGQLARERDQSLARLSARHARRLKALEKEHRQRMVQVRERQRREIVETYELFESQQEARLNFLAWRATA